MDKILGMGNALTDALVKIEDDSLLDTLHLPKGSMQLIDLDTLRLIREKTAGMTTVRATGGSAGNTIMALAHLGADVSFLGKVGEDETGRFFENTLLGAGVQTHLLRGNFPSGIASTFVSSDGERTFGTYLGSAVTLSADDISSEMFAGCSYLYIEGYLVQNHSLIERALSLAKQAGLQICIDLASYNLVEAERDYFDSMITRYADIVFANSSEALALTGKGPLEAVEIIGQKCSVAIVKSGKKGSIVKKGTETLHITPCDVPRVDTTGAGDFYAAGFLYALSSGFSLEKCLQTASILSNHVIQVVGTSLSSSCWEQIKLNVDQVLHS